MVHPRFYRSHLFLPKLSDKPENVDEPACPPPDAFYLHLVVSEPQYHHVSGHAHEAGYGVAHCLRPPRNQCACCNSCLDAALNGYDPNFKNKPPVGSQLSEVILRLAVFPSLPVIHPQPVELPVEPPQQ